MATILHGSTQVAPVSVRVDPNIGYETICSVCHGWVLILIIWSNKVHHKGLKRTTRYDRN